MKELYPSFAIVSAQTPSGPNPERHAWLLRAFPGAFEVDGSYMGTPEKSVVLPLKSLHTGGAFGINPEWLPHSSIQDVTLAEARLPTLAKLLGQACILLVDGNRRAYSITQDGTTTPLGRFVKVEVEPLPDSWTEFPSGEIYTTEEQ